MGSLSGCIGNVVGWCSEGQGGKGLQLTGPGHVENVTEVCISTYAARYTQMGAELT